MALALLLPIKPRFSYFGRSGYIDKEKEVSSKLSRLQSLCCLVYVDRRKERRMQVNRVGKKEAKER